MALSEEVIDEYKTSLKDLHVNSKPLINMLTMLAEDHEQHAPEIVKVIEDHINKCKPGKKLPVLYLMDSIMKNLGDSTNYKSLFSKNIVQTFTSVFEQVDEKTRASMYKLRQTWTSILPNAKLYMIDVRINNLMDHAWPITATPPEKTSIHVNPKFLNKAGSSGSGSERSSPEAVFIDDDRVEEEPDTIDQEAIMRQQLIAKQQELLELQQARIKLELAEAEEKLKSLGKHGTKSQTAATSKFSSLPLPPMVDNSDLADPIWNPPQPTVDPRKKQADPRMRDPRVQTQPYSELENTQEMEATVSSTVPFMGPTRGQNMGGQGVPPQQIPYQDFNPMDSMQYPHGVPPFMQRGFGEGQNIFKGTVFPEDAKFSDSNDSDSSRSSFQDSRSNKAALQPKVNVKDPRLRRQLQDKKVGNQNVKVDNKGSDLSNKNRDPRRPVASPKSSSGHPHKDTKDSKQGDKVVKDPHSTRSSGDNSSIKSPRKSSSDSQNSKSRSTSKDSDSKSYPNLRDTFEAEKRKIDDRGKDEERDSKYHKKDLGSRHSERSSRSREKSPGHPSKPHSNKPSHHKGGGDNSSSGKSTHDNRNRDRNKDNSSKSANKKTDSQSDNKRENKSANSKHVSGSAKSNKREKSSPIGGEDERLSKKPKLTSKEETIEATEGNEMEVDQKPNVKVSNDLSELFGSEDIDYRPVDQKGLPLKSPSSKGWDKYKASQPDQFAYDIELKKQRQDVDQRRTRQMSEASENQDTDLRGFGQGDTLLSPPLVERDIPKELSLSQHSEIIIQAQKQLREGKITAKQHQDLMQQVQELMQIQQKLQEENSKPGDNSQGIGAESMNESPSRNLFQNFESELKHQSPREDANQPLNQGFPTEGGPRSPERPMERFKIPKKSHDMDSPKKDKRGLHELYPERIKEEAWEYGPPVLSREFEPHPHRDDTPEWVPPPNLNESRRPPFDRKPEHRGPNFRTGDSSERLREHPHDFNRQHGRRDQFEASEGPPEIRHGPPDVKHGPKRDWYEQGEYPNLDSRIGGSHGERQDHRQIPGGQNDFRKDPNWIRSPRDEGERRPGIGRGRLPDDELLRHGDGRQLIGRELDFGPDGMDHNRREMSGPNLSDKGPGHFEGPQDHHFDRPGPPLHRPGGPGSPPFGRPGPSHLEHERRDPHGPGIDRNFPQDPNFGRPGPQGIDPHSGHPKFGRHGPSNDSFGKSHRQDFDPSEHEFERRGLSGPEVERYGPKGVEKGLDFDRKGSLHHGPVGAPRPEGPFRPEFERQGPPRPGFDGPSPAGPEFDRSGPFRPAEPDFDVPGHQGAAHGKMGSPRFDSEGRKPHEHEFDMPDYDKHLGHSRSEFGRLGSKGPRLGLKGPEFERIGPPESEFLRPGPPEPEYNRPRFPSQDLERLPNLESHGPPGSNFDRHGPPRPSFDRIGPGSESDRQGHSGPEFDRPGPQRPEFDRPGPTGPEFERSGPPRPPFDRPGPPRPGFDRPGPPGPEFDRPGPPIPEFDKPNHRGLEFERPGPPRPEFERHGPEIDRPGPPRPEFDRPGPPRPEFDRPGPPRPEFDRQGPDFDRSGPPRPEFDRPGPPRPEFDRPGPPRPEFDRPGPPRPEFDRPGPPRPEFDRPGLNLRRTGPPGQEFDNREPLGPNFDRPGPPEFDRQDRWNPDMERQGQHGPDFDRQRHSGPDFDRLGQSRHDFDRIGSQRRDKEKEPFRSEYDKHGPPHDSRFGPDFEGQRGPPGHEFDRFHKEDHERDGPPFDRHRNFEPHMEGQNRHRERFDRHNRNKDKDWSRRRDELSPEFERFKCEDERNQFGRNFGPGGEFELNEKQGHKKQDERYPEKLSDKGRGKSPQKDNKTPENRNKGSRNTETDESSQINPQKVKKEIEDNDNKETDHVKPAFDPNKGLPPWRPVDSPVKVNPNGKENTLKKEKLEHRDDQTKREDRRTPPVYRDDRRTPPLHRDDRRTPPLQSDDRRTPPLHRDDRRTPPLHRDDRRTPPLLKDRGQEESLVKKESQDRLPSILDGIEPELVANQHKVEDPVAKKRPTVPEGRFNPMPSQLLGIPESPNKKDRREPPVADRDDRRDPEKPDKEEKRGKKDKDRRRDRQDKDDRRGQDRQGKGDRRGQGRQDKDDRRGPGRLDKDDRRGPGRLDKDDRRGPGRLDKDDRRGPGRLDKDDRRGPGRLDKDDRRGPGRPDRDERRGPMPPQEVVEGYVDKYGDPRFRCFTDMGPEVSEEVVFGKRNYEIKLGAPPRKIQWGNGFIEVFADPSKRGIVIDNELLYRFGERVKEVNIRGKREKIFYHGKPLDIWIDGNNYEVRVDSPPKTLIINNNPHRIQVDGRDMMILIDKAEMGPYGGEPRFILIDDMRMELRFDPPPRHILIDGDMCELKLNVRQPAINIKGVLRGIRFKGPPRDVFINGSCYQVFTDHAVKLRVGNRFHYVALGGPCHELIVDGKWYEVKFDEPPKEINVGNRVLMVRIPGGPPEVMILDPIPMEPVHMPMFNPGPLRMPMPGQPMGPGPRPMGPPQQPMMPGMPGMMMGQPVSGPNPMVNPAVPGLQPPMGPPQTGVIPGLGNMIPGIQPSQPNPMPMSNVGPTPGMPTVLSGLFPARPAAPATTTSAPAAGLDINSLLSKLVSSGIIKKEPETKPAPVPISTVVTPAAPPKSDNNTIVAEAIKAAVAVKRKPVVVETFEDIPDKTSFDLIDLKELHEGAIQRLYAGAQCTSCGARFSMDNDEKADRYKQHLDWHFRQNKLKKDDTKVTQCRKWYYGVGDWIQYEEVTDQDDQSKSVFFEQQNPAQPATPAQSQQMAFAVPEGASVIKCPPATGNDQDDLCNICHEPFEQFWHEEHEEWHLREAIRVNNKTYHPICYEDYTDVSEGTPSPSVLLDKQPDFSSRKSLTYEESSQDSVPHSSFEEERNVPNTSLIKSEPVMSLETEVKSEPQTVNTDIKTEDSGLIKTEFGSYVSETSALSNSQPDSSVKQEPGTDSQGLLTDQYSSVKLEPMEEDSAQKPSVILKCEYPNSAIPGLDTSMSEYEPMELSEEKRVSKQQILLSSQESMVTDSVNSSVPDSGVKLEPVSGDDSKTDNVDSNQMDTVENSAVETADRATPTLDEDSAHMEHIEGNTPYSHTSESLITEHSSPFVSHVSDIDIHRVSRIPEIDSSVEAQTLSAPVHHSSTLSPLKRVIVSQPADVIEISQEVLEISSNASTPTHDELPSPPSPGS